MGAKRRILDARKASSSQNNNNNNKKIVGCREQREIMLRAHVPYDRTVLKGLTHTLEEKRGNHPRVLSHSSLVPRTAALRSAWQPRISKNMSLATMPAVCLSIWHGCCMGREQSSCLSVGTAESSRLPGGETGSLTSEVREHGEAVSFLRLKASSGKQIGVMHYLSLHSKQIPLGRL